MAWCIEWRIVSVLLWKNILVRKRKLIVTACEYLLPMALFVLVFLLWGAVISSDLPVKYRRMDSDMPTSRGINESYVSPQRIFYTPSTNLTRRLMKSVADKLKLEKKAGSKINAFKISGEFFDIFNYTKSEKMRPNDAVVIFEELKEDDNLTFPSTLKYTIRMMTPFKLDSDLDLEDEPNPIPTYDTGQPYDSFMRLQSVIDDCFLEMATGNDIDEQDVTIVHGFPYMRTMAKKRALIMGPTSFAILCGLFITFVILVGKLVGERMNGVQELMKMSGVTALALSFAHFVDTLPGMMVYAVSGTLMTCVVPPVIMAKTNVLIVFLILFLHSCTIFAVAFAVSYIIRVESNAQLLAVVAYIVLWIPGSMLVRHTPQAAQFVIGIWPFVPVLWTAREIADMQRSGEGLTFSTMMVAHSSTMSVMWALVFMLLQVPLYLLLAWYLAHVIPGKFGLAMPWNFLCKTQYWCKSKEKPDLDEDIERTQTAPVNQEFFEPPPTHGHIGIRVVNVSKVFLKYRALNNVSLDVYRGELTVLLGHNGAGKTTLMSIMTGMIKPTSGKVYLGGKDIARREDARRQVGFCPQHNMFFPKVSVIEHVVIFSIAWKSSEVLLAKLGLKEKANNLSNELSGGMKRRLQLACALAGGADVLILDEPSSGLDVETRRHLWDLILALRGSRTVLISTHFMEEADALGDRVAALHNGVLRCHASPMFLKKAIGTGYRLTLITNGPPNGAAITQLVTSSVPDATVKGTTMNSITYALPSASSAAFPQLFSKLESKKADLGVDSIGVGVSTLEEVFLLLCSNIDTSNLSEDEVDGVRRVEPTYELTTGMHLCFQQFCQLVKRQVMYIYFYKYIFIIGQVIIPIALIVGCAASFKNDAPKAKPPAEDSQSMSLPNDRAYRMLHRSHRDVGGLSSPYPVVDLELDDDLPYDIFRVGKGDLLEYHKNIAGVEMNDTHAKVMYTTTIRHASPASTSLLTDMLVNRAAYGHRSSKRPPVPAPEGLVNYATDNRSLQVQASPPAIRKAKDQLTSVTYMTTLSMIILSTLMPAVSLPIMERISGARWIHLMAGCSPELYWAVHLLFRLTLAAVIIIMPVLVTFAFDVDKTLSETEFLMSTAVILVLGIMAFLAFLYLLSFCGGLMAVNIVVFIFITIGVIFNLMWSISAGVFRMFLDVSLHVLPAQALAHALMHSAGRARVNAVCHLNPHLCPGMAGKNIQCFFCLDGVTSAGYAMVLLSVHFIFYGGLVLMMQRRVIAWCLERLQAKIGDKKRPPPATCSEDFVINERAYVENAIALPTKQIPDVMLVSKVFKCFGMGQPFCAIKGISFSVKKGECLGLLGMNGAGKSSTFRVLTAEDWPTYGQVFAAGRHRKGFSTAYMRRMSYCPQFFGTDNFLTGRQNLVLLLSLKGLNGRDAGIEAESWIRIVGLEKYSNRAVVGYSGGCERRLVAAAALCMGKPLTLLDEPTSGVDVSARRRVWAALRRGLAQQRAVIITSHSMDEMEALCHRIAIMAAGHLCALGSPQELRAAYASGHAVIIKVRLPPPGGSPESDQDWIEQDPQPKQTQKKQGHPKKKKLAESEPTQTQPMQSQPTQTHTSRRRSSQPDPQKQQQQTQTQRPESQPAKEQETQTRKKGEPSTQQEQLRQPVDESYQTAQRKELKQTFEKTFNCTLKDEHKTMLHYHINETLAYSKLFQEMERLRRAFPDFVEDYSVTETTLEEVFLSFAKYNVQEEKPKKTPPPSKAKAASAKAKAKAKARPKNVSPRRRK